jgi:hypothetical protein
MSNIEFITNNRLREFKCYHDVPHKIRETHFDWVDVDSDMFVKYGGNWYTLSEFSTINGIENFEKWSGYISDTYFSGIVIKLVEDEGYVIGRFYVKDGEE